MENHLELLNLSNEFNFFEGTAKLSTFMVKKPNDINGNEFWFTSYLTKFNAEKEHLNTTPLCMYKSALEAVHNHNLLWKALSGLDENSVD